MAAGDVETAVTTIESGEPFGYFNGTAAFVETSLDDVSTLGTTFSIVADIYPTGDSLTTQGIFDNDTAGSRGVVFGYNVDEKFYLQHNEGSRRNMSSTNVITQNTWTNVIGIWDGSEWVMYINGTLDATASGGAGPSSGALVDNSLNVKIGKDTYDVNVSRHFKGRLKNIRVYANKILSQAEITALQTERVSEGLTHEWLLTSDYTDTVGSADGTNNGALITAENTVETELASQRAGASDHVMMIGLGGQVVSATVQES